MKASLTESSKIAPFQSNAQINKLSPLNLFRKKTLYINDITPTNNESKGSKIFASFALATLLNN